MRGIFERKKMSIKDENLNLDKFVHTLSHRDKRIWLRFKLKGYCGLGDKYFAATWRIGRILLYAARKDAGLPDPLDVFDNFKGPIFRPAIRENK